MFSDPASRRTAGEDSDDRVVSLRGISKTYDRQPRAFQWSAMLGRDAAPHVAHHALTAVDIDLHKAESVAVIGRNGAGKSTMLKIIAGVTRASRGTVRVRGSVGAMIELGVGFHPDLTGRENVYCSLVMQGLSHTDIPDLYPAIVAFAGIHDAMDTPVKHYSMGMRARLGFAVATQQRPDVLLVDEILAVGDRDFQQRCFARISTMIDQGTALLFVTHHMPLVASVCDRAIRLEDGHVVDDDIASDVVERYLTSARLRRPSDLADSSVIISGVSTPDEIQPREGLTIDAELEVRRPIDKPRLRFDLSLPLFAPDLVTVSSQEEVPALERVGRYRLSGLTSPIAAEGVRYRITMCVTDPTGRVLSNEVSTDFTITGGAVGAVPRFSGKAQGTITAAEPNRRPTRRSNAIDDASVVARVVGLTKTFEVGRPRADLVRAVPWHHPVGKLKALDDLSLEVARGDSVGLIGPNGAGKSTLLRILAGLTSPDSGCVQVSGRTVPMLGIGIGLYRDFTGSENIDVIGRLLGMDKRTMATVRKEVLGLAGLGDAVDVPVRQYSSGMEARLALALSMFCPGELLLIDELLAAGDENFRSESMEAIRRRHAQGDTIVFVSHELNLVEALCDRVVWLQNGSLVDDGDAAEILEDYGHKGWAAGVHDATCGVRLRALRVRRPYIDTGESVEFSGRLIVDEPAPSGRLEVSYRLPPEDRNQPLTTEQRLDLTPFVATLIPPGAQISKAGEFEYSGRIDHNDWVGEVDLVVSVIDEQNNEVLAETYEPITVGRSTGQGFPMLAVSAEWSVDSLDEGIET